MRAINIFVVLAIIVRIFSNCQSNVIQKSLAIKGFNPISINAITYFILACFSVFALCLIGLGSISYKFLYYSFIVGLLGAIGNGFLIKALEKGDLSVLGPLNAYKSVIALLFALVFLAEIPSLIGVLGMLLILFGSYFVMDTVRENGDTIFSVLKNKQIQYRFIALLFTAIEAVFIKKIIVLSSVAIAFFAWCILGALFSLLILKINKLSLRKEFIIIKNKSILCFIGIAICVGVMQYTTNFVFDNMNVAYALSLFQLSALVSVIFGYKIFNEKNIRKKLFGAFVMVLGSVLIILYN